MRRAIVFLFAIFLLAPLSVPSAVAQPQDMKSTAPEKMLPPGQAEKMRACDAKAMEMNIPMEQKAAFVKKCMAEMK